jgi:hypothetical protein
MKKRSTFLKKLKIWPKQLLDSPTLVFSDKLKFFGGKANTLSYFNQEKSFITSTPGPNVIKLFTAVSKEFL